MVLFSCRNFGRNGMLHLQRWDEVFVEQCHLTIKLLETHAYFGGGQHCGCWRSIDKASGHQFSVIHPFTQPVSQNGHFSLRWRHDGCDSVSNHQPHDCLLNRLFRHRSKKTSKLRVTGLCAGNSPGTGEFPAQMVSDTENVSIWWRHHVMKTHWATMLNNYPGFTFFCL